MLSQGRYVISLVNVYACVTYISKQFKHSLARFVGMMIRAGITGLTLWPVPAPLWDSLPLCWMVIISIFFFIFITIVTDNKRLVA